MERNKTERGTGARGMERNETPFLWSPPFRFFQILDSYFLNLLNRYFYILYFIILLQGAQYRRKFFGKKIRRYCHIRRYWALSAILGTKIIFCSKSEKRVGVRNDVMCQTFF
jgi:hypothetical protein